MGILVQKSSTRLSKQITDYSFWVTFEQSSEGLFLFSSLSPESLHHLFPVLMHNAPVFVIDKNQIF